MYLSLMTKLPRARSWSLSSMISEVGNLANFKYLMISISVDFRVSIEYTATVGARIGLLYHIYVFILKIFDNVNIKIAV